MLYVTSHVHGMLMSNINFSLPRTTKTIANYKCLAKTGTVDFTDLSVLYWEDSALVLRSNRLSNITDDTVCFTATISREKKIATEELGIRLMAVPLIRS